MRNGMYMYMPTELKNSGQEKGEEKEGGESSQAREVLHRHTVTASANSLLHRHTVTAGANSLLHRHTVAASANSLLHRHTVTANANSLPESLPHNLCKSPSSRDW